MAIPQKEYLISPEIEYEHDLKFRKKIQYPKQCILCYQDSFIKLAKDNFKAKKIDSLLGFDFYTFNVTNKTIGIICSGIGAPCAALLLERLIVRGVSCVLNIGIAGSIQYENIAIGNIILCEKSLRLEGTSLFYGAKTQYAHPDKEFTDHIERTLTQKKAIFKKGPTLSTDAPYRIRVSDCSRYRKEGIIACDMEASAIFEISRLRGIKSAAMFVISDLAKKDFSWAPGFYEQSLEEGKNKLMEMAVQIFFATDYQD